MQVVCWSGIVRIPVNSFFFLKSPVISRIVSGTYIQCLVKARKRL